METGDSGNAQKTTFKTARVFHIQSSTLEGQRWIQVHVKELVESPRWITFIDITRFEFPRVCV